MSWDNLKNRLQEDSSQKEVKLDIDDIWAAIEPEVDVINQERRKKRFFFYWLVGLALVVTTGSLYFVFNKNTKEQITQDEAIEFVEEVLEEKETTTAGIENIKSFENKNTQALSKEINQSLKQSAETTVDTDKKDHFANKKISKKENVTTKSNNKLTRINTAKSSKTALDDNADKNKLPWKISQSDQRIQPMNELANSDLILSSNNVADENEVVKELLSISKLSLLTMNLRVVEKGILPLNEISGFYKAYTPEEIKKILTHYREPNFTFSLGLMGGLGSAPNTLSTKNDTLINPLLQIRRETESSLETSQFGIAFALRHKSGLHFSSGLQQTTFVEKVAFDNTITEVKEIEGIIEIRVTTTGDSIPVFGIIPETTVNTIEKRHYVRYKLLEVPLIIGWQTKDKNNTGWNFGVEAGIVPNLTLKTTGRIFDEEYQSIDIGTNQEAYFKKNIGLSYHLGFSVRRMLGENIELSFKPTVRFFPKDFSSDSNDISQKYNLVSGQLGVSYLFGN